MGTYMCVAGKLYLLMTVLVLSIMFYVLAEYRLRHNDDDVFEDPWWCIKFAWIFVTLMEVLGANIVWFLIDRYDGDFDKFADWKYCL